MGEKTTAMKQEIGVSGNVQRAAEVFFEYGEFIRNVIRCKIRDEQKAGDLFQDLFLSICAKPIPTNVRNIKSFLYKAIINDIIDRARALERYQNLTHNFANFQEQIVNNQTPLNALIEREETEKLIELIGQITTKREARAISLRYYENLPVTEVAGKMGIDNRSVSRYISAGLRKVRQLFIFAHGE